MAVDGALEGLESSGDEVEEGGLSSSVLADDGDTGVHATEKQKVSKRAGEHDGSATHSIPKERSL